MSKNIKSITNPKLSLNILTPAEVKKLHDATLQILEQVGVRFPPKKRLKSGPPTAPRSIIRK